MGGTGTSSFGAGAGGVAAGSGASSVGGVSLVGGGSGAGGGAAACSGGGTGGCGSGLGASAAGFEGRFRREHHREGRRLGGLRQRCRVDGEKQQREQGRMNTRRGEQRLRDRALPRGSKRRARPRHHQRHLRREHRLCRNTPQGAAAPRLRVLLAPGAWEIGTGGGGREGAVSLIPCVASERHPDAAVAANWRGRRVAARIGRVRCLSKENR